MQFDFLALLVVLLILDWLLSSFWLCEEAKGFYLPLHLGQNSKIKKILNLIIRRIGEKAQKSSEQRSGPSVSHTTQSGSPDQHN